MGVVLCATACGNKTETVSTTENYTDNNFQITENVVASDYVNYNEILTSTECVSETVSNTEITAKPTAGSITEASTSTVSSVPVKTSVPSTTIMQINSTTAPVKVPSVSVPSVVCIHNNTVVKGKINATTEYEGYTGDTYCNDCGALIHSGEVIEKIKEQLQEGYMQYPCPDGSTITVPVGTNIFDYTVNKANKTASHDFYDIEKQVVDLFNEERERLGIAAAPFNEDTYYYVKTRAIELQELFSHTRPNGDNFSGVYTDEGIILCAMGENLVGHITVRENEDIANKIFNAIMSSPSHKSTALDSRFNQMSVALTYYEGQYYFCQHMYENIIH